ALFVRAILHFYLANLFGGIPYITTSDYRENKQVSRMAISDVYAHSIKDLDRATSLLGNNYIIPDRTRPNKSTVMAVLARVYLYDHQWQKAANSSSYVLDGTDLYTWEDDLENVFLKESGSTLWQFAPGYSGANTKEGETFIFTSAPPRLVALTEGFMTSF